MRIQLSAVLAGVMAVSLVGCGLKGPLYFPPESKEVKSDTTVVQSQSGEQTQKNQSNMRLEQTPSIIDK